MGVFQNKNNLLMINKRKIIEKIQWVKSNNLPESLYLKDITNTKIDLELVLEFMILCDIEVDKMNIGYTMLININDSSYDEWEFLGLSKIQIHLQKLIEYDSANITFFNIDLQNLSKNYSLEVHKYKINKLINSKNIDKFNFYYFEVRTDEIYEFQRNILIELC